MATEYKLSYTATEINEKLGKIPDVLQTTGNSTTDTMSQTAITNALSQLSSEKVDKASISLGIASDGLIYIFVNGQPVGTGISQGQSGDVFGYVDENNTIVLNGNLVDGTYLLKYEMDNGSVVNIGNMVLDSTVYYSVTSTLTKCTSSNGTKTIAEGGSYSTTITAESGYSVSSIKVTMGGTDITSSAVSGTKITIASVTDDIIITATAKEIVVNYTNLFNPATAILNKRISSSNTLSDASGKMTTDFINVDDHIPFTESTKIYIKGATFTNDGNTKIKTFKTASGTDYTNGYSSINGSAIYSSIVDEGNGVISISGTAITSSFVEGVRRMVLTLQVSTSNITADDIKDIVITIDEPIG